MSRRTGTKGRVKARAGKAVKWAVELPHIGGRPLHKRQEKAIRRKFNTQIIKANRAANVLSNEAYVLGEELEELEGQHPDNWKRDLNSAWKLLRRVKKSLEKLDEHFQLAVNEQEDHEVFFPRKKGRQ